MPLGRISGAGSCLDQQAIVQLGFKVALERTPVDTWAQNLVAHLAWLRFSPSVPNAFTEHGAAIVANILNSDREVAERELQPRALRRPG